MIFRLLVLVLGLMGPVSAASTPTVRIAVVSDGEEKDLASSVMAELSSRPAITLVERDDLAKIGDELEVQQLAGSDAVALGKLIGADGLLFLDKNGDHLKARFTAVGLGFVLFDLSIPPGIDPGALVKSLGDRVAQFTSKLELTPDRAVPLSLLNFRSELALGHSEETQHHITLLLESRLAAVPEYVVLERRHADALGFEHSILTPTPPEVLKGAYVIDGSFRPAGVDADGEIVVSLRVRSPKTGQDTSIVVKGSEKDLPTLINAMVEKIGQKIGSSGSPVAWQPQDEAKEYIREANWAWIHSTDTATLEALDNAVLLGDHSLDLRSFHIRVLCEVSRLETGRWRVPKKVPPTLEERVELLRRAMQEMIELHAVETPPTFGAPGQDPPGHQGGLDRLIFGRASDLLHDLEASPRTDLTNFFRQELRTFVDFDPLHGKVPSDVSVDDLTNSAEEEMACYRFWVFKQHSVIVEERDRLCPRFYKNQAERQAGYDKWMQELQTDPWGRLLWLSISCVRGNAATRETLYPQLLQELWNQREELFHSVKIRQLLGYLQWIDADVRKKYIKQSLPLFHYWLSNPDAFASSEMVNFLPLAWYSPEDIDGIWNDLQKQKAALLAQGTNAWSQSDLVRFEAYFFQTFPSRRPPDPDLDPDAALPRLTVNRYWFGKDLVESDADVDVVTGQFATRWQLLQFGPTPDGSGVWGLTYHFPSYITGSGFFEVHLPDMASKLIDTNCGRPLQAVRTAHDYYVTYAVENVAGSPRAHEIYLKRYDLDSHAWAQRRLTEVTNTGYIDALDDRIYLRLRDLTDGIWEGGLARYDWETDKFTILASSRRKPAQNQFDDRADYDLSLFAGPGNKPCMAGPGGIYYMQEKPGPWPKWSFDFSGNVVRNGRQTLITTGNGEAVLVDPDKPAPIPLMVPAVANDGEAKKLPSWAAEAVWKYRGEWGDFGNVGYHEGHLYRLFQRTVQKNSYKLLVFNPGQPDPVVIPLRFLFKGSEETADKILRWGGTIPYRLYDQYGLVAAAQGICLKNDWGFWFVPYSDIDAYVKSNPTMVNSR